MDTLFPEWRLLTAPPGYRPDTRLKTLWLARWKDRGATIVPAFSRTEALHRLDVLDNAPTTSAGRGRGSVDSIDALADFEMRVADGTRDSRPRWHRLRLDHEEIRWSRAGDDAGAGTTLRESSSQQNRIWGYVWCEGDVVVFTAPDFDTARRRVVEAASSWGLRDLGDTEAVQGRFAAIDRLEMEFESAGGTLLPVSYKVWAGRDPFVWPPRSRHPDDDGDDRLPAEARLPVPTYVKVDVRTSRRAPTWTRRTATRRDLQE